MIPTLELTDIFYLGIGSIFVLTGELTITLFLRNDLFTIYERVRLLFECLIDNCFYFYRSAWLGEDC